MFAIWNDSFVDPVYSNGDMRMKMRSNDVKNSTGL